MTYIRELLLITAVLLNSFWLTIAYIRLMWSFRKQKPNGVQTATKVKIKIKEPTARERHVVRAKKFFKTWLVMFAITFISALVCIITYVVVYEMIGG